MSKEKKFTLPESAIPTSWVNFVADAAGDPLLPLSAPTGEPVRLGA